MPLIQVDGPDAPRVGEYAHLSDAGVLQTRGLFVAEGRLVVTRLIRDTRYSIRSVLVSEAAGRALASNLSALPGDVPVYTCPASALADITGIDFHRGCLALAERPAPRPLPELLAGTGAVVILERVTDPDNLGGVFRNAAAFGADGVILSPTCCDPLYRKAVRTSMSATLQVPFARADHWPGALEEVRRFGLTIAALSPREHAASIDLSELSRRSDRIALLVGTEGDGLSAAAEACADLCVRIPIRPDVDSLNLAVATGIALYALTTRSRLSGPPECDSRFRG
jgi:tRNA G18 (ribose-2'-O)-methylase SpoU